MDSIDGCPSKDTQRTCIYKQERVKAQSKQAKEKAFIVPAERGVTRREAVLGHQHRRPARDATRGQERAPEASKGSPCGPTWSARHRGSGGTHRVRKDETPPTESGTRGMPSTGRQRGDSGADKG